MERHGPAIPAAAWKRRLDQTLETPGKPSRKLTPRMLLKVLPWLIRLSAYNRQEIKAGRTPIVDPLSPNRPGPTMGVPIGGIGSGTITRGWQGEFRRWQLRPGVYEYNPVFADQFSIFVQREGQRPNVQTLYPGQPNDRRLSAWQWNMDGGCATYHALFPFAWTVYEEPVPGIRLTCKQFSPVIPHNYRESSFPMGLFTWTIENLTSKSTKIGLMFSFQNGIGTSNDLAGGHFNRHFRLKSDRKSDAGHDVVGITLHHIHRQIQALEEGQWTDDRERYEDPLTFAIAAHEQPDIEVSFNTRFITTGDGSDVYADFAENGRLGNLIDERSAPPAQAIGAAVAITTTIPSGESKQVTFALSWDMPLVRVGMGRRYYRRYSRFYGVKGDAAPTMARDALTKRSTWEHQIVEWQKPILDDTDLPEWYKSALFNELYYIVDGGTLWVHTTDNQDSMGDEIGQFAYLEGQEYRMYNTYDVHFYASFALAMLWPKLEISLQRDIARCIRTECPDERRMIVTGHICPRKPVGMTPHDIGSPGGDPWRLVNAYNLHDSSKWKDLNPKFVLQVYRDYITTGNKYFIADVWDAVEETIESARQFDRNGDGMIENEGIPDQTYDTWSVSGVSAYTGGLWLACLLAAAEMADILGEKDRALTYRTVFKQAQTVYIESLWNGRYFDYDSSDTPFHNSIMADQLAGQWYARATDLDPIVEPEQIPIALRTIFEYNIKRFKDGTMGAVNGMRPEGWVDRASLQSQEVWTGTTYALAAAMLQEGLEKEAFETAIGIYRMTYHERGYWFQTPEAWDEDGNYRSLAYMRPLAIWAMQWAWERRKGIRY